MEASDRLTLPRRAGPPPETTRPTREHAIAHSQMSQNAPKNLQDALFERARDLAGVTVGDSHVSVPGARAFHLDEQHARGPDDAFQAQREFAHLHPSYDGSLHLTLPRAAYDEVADKGWGEPHPISGTMMIFGPRDEDELETVWQIVETSYRYATGDLTT